jgi:hypothetical protein
MQSIEMLGFKVNSMLAGNDQVITASRQNARKFRDKVKVKFQVVILSATGIDDSLASRPGCFNLRTLPSLGTCREGDYVSKRADLDIV